MSGLARACALAAGGGGDEALDVFVAVEALARGSGIELAPWFRKRAEHAVRAGVAPESWRLVRAAARSLTRSEAKAVL